MTRRSLVSSFVISLALLPACAMQSGEDPLGRAEGELPCTTCGDRGGDPGGPTLPKPPALVMPEFSFMANLCLPDTARDALRASLQQRLPGSDVRAACVSSKQVFGVWLDAPSAFSPAAARDAGLQKVAILQPGEGFALQLGAPGVTHAIDAVFAKRPHALDESGNPNAKGPIFLDSLDVSFLAPTTLQTVIGGHYDAAIDIGFDVTRTETLSLSNKKIACSANTSVDAPALTALDFLTGFIPLGDPLQLAALDFDRAMHANVAAFEGSQSSSCFVGSVIPGAIPLAGPSAAPFRGQKVDLSYTRLAVGGAVGISTGGQWAIVPRAPKVRIAGAGEAPNHGTSVALSIETTDLVPPFTVTWSSSDGKVSKTVDTGDHSNIVATWTPPSEFGNWMHTGHVHVTVTDVDGLSASADKSVFINYTESGLPPICDKKPYLPQCNP